MGFAYHLESYLELQSGQEPIYAIEPFEEMWLEPVFQDRLKNLSAIYPNLKIIKPIQMQISVSKIFIQPYYEKYCKTEVQTIIDKILPQKKTLLKNTKVHFNRLWLRNYCIHIQKIPSKNKVTFLNQETLPLKDKDVLFIGASPFLEEQMLQVQKLQNQCFIIASDTIVHFLLANRIRIDVILSIDSGRGTYYHLHSGIPKQIPIITWLGGNRLIWEFENPVIIYLSTHPFDQLLQTIIGEGYPIVKNLSLNIAGLAKSLAEISGAKNLLLAGVNFLSLGNKTHSRGTGYEYYNLDKYNRYYTSESGSFGSYRNKSLSNKNKNSLEQLFLENDSVKIIQDIENFESVNYRETSQKNVSFVTDSFNISKFVILLQDKQILESVSKELEIEPKILKRLIAYFFSSSFLSDSDTDS